MSRWRWKEQSRYAELRNRGVSRKALFAAGEAIHTATDNTSPVHNGFQIWRGLIGKNILETFMLIRQAARHAAAEDTITDEEFDEAVKAAQEVYRITFGEKLFKEATTVPKSSSKSRSVKGENLFDYDSNLMLRPDGSSRRFRGIGCIE